MNAPGDRFRRSAGRLLTGVLAIALGAPALGAQEAAVLRGQVRSAAGPVPHAQVGLRSVSAAATVADDEGRFVLQARAGTFTLEVRAVGFAPVTQSVVLRGGDTLSVSVVLASAPAALAPVVTTGTLRSVIVAESPVKVEVVSERALRRSASSELTEALRGVNGLYTQVDCGVCFTSNIRVNGMEGPYTAVLIDGAPLMSALASVYGLSGINPAIVQQVEVIRGPASTLYGTEAMGGVINVITRDPRFAPRWTLHTASSSHGEHTLDAAAAQPLGGGHLLLSASGQRNDRFVDGNHDGFTDLPLVTRLALFGKWGHAGASPERRTLDLSARVYHEDRFGGVRAWTRADRGSDEIYGEWIRTNRWETVARWRLPVEREAARLELSFTNHEQDSWYGAERFVARQRVAFAQLLWDERLRDRHELLFGATLRHQRYDDDTPITAAADVRWIPGVFAQDELTLSPALTLLGGLRVDHHRDHGAIPAPRLALKWTAGDETVVRLNAATGFRVVSLFAEDHRALTGARRVVLAEALRPERSATVAASVNHHVHLGGAEDPIVIDGDLFVTHFTNRIQPDYEREPDAIVYANLDGHARTQGISLAAAWEPALSPWGVTAGVTLQDVHVVHGGERRPLPFSPRVQGVWSVSRAFPGAVTLDWTGRLVGPQPLPHVDARPDQSPWYSEQHVQATATLRYGLDAYVAVKNLLGFRQSDPLVAPHDPFGPDFDTVQVYGPTQGRRVQIGVRYAASR